jgi:hypothetical protein
MDTMNDTPGEDAASQEQRDLRDRLLAIVAAAASVSDGDMDQARELVLLLVTEDPELQAAYDRGVQGQLDEDVRREVRSWLVQNGYRPMAEDPSKWEKPPPEASGRSAQPRQRPGE